MACVGGVKHALRIWTDEQADTAKWLAEVQREENEIAEREAMVDVEPMD
jgi:hypothetical protein